MSAARRPSAVLLGYHDIGAVCLEELVAAGADIVLVVTHEDSPGEEIWFRSVRDLAASLGIETIAPADVNDPAVVDRIRALAPDFLFSAMFRKMLKTPLLAIPTRGALNLHPSLLPKFRGRSPINWVLVQGETETGVSLHYMVEKPDRGDVVAQRRIAIRDDDTALTLHRRATEEARVLFREALPLLFAGRAPRIAQDPSRASYFGGRTAADGEIDWSWPAKRIYDLVRAVTHPYPGAFTWHGDRRLMIWWARPSAASSGLAPGTIHVNADGEVSVGTGGGALRLERVALDGDAEIAAADWARGGGCRTGDTLGRKR